MPSEEVAAAAVAVGATAAAGRGPRGERIIPFIENMRACSSFIRRAAVSARLASASLAWRVRMDASTADPIV
jgi:hypothetical protein